MPQLDFSTFPSQAFWLIIIFALMWLMMAKVIVPKITDILNQRQHKIDDYLAAAGEFKQAAETVLEKYERVLQKANERAADIMRENNEDLQRKIAEHSEKTAQRLTLMSDDSRRQIEENRMETMERIEKISEKLAADIAGKLGLDLSFMPENTISRNKQDQENE